MKTATLYLMVAGFVAVAAVCTVSRRVQVRDRRVAGSIISLAPSVTEIVFALGLDERLLGISTACDYPPETKNIRKVGNFGAPKMELIYALKPELVITTSLRDPEAAEVIRRSGATLLVVPQDNVKQVLDAIVKIGEAAGVPQVAQEYASKLRERIAGATRAVPEDKRPRVFVELSQKPLRTVGKRSFVHDLIRRAGGRNIAGDFDRAWLTISPATVVARDPEIIIVAHPLVGDARSAMARRIGWAGIAAVKSGYVIDDLDLDLLLRPGPRLADGLQALTKLFEKYREDRTR